MIKVIITGTTGFVGEGVLLECLNSPIVEKVLSVSRKPIGHQHDKLTELVVPSFSDLKEGDERLQGYDACFFCAGISSNGMQEKEYREITHDLTINFTKSLGVNKNLTFIYVSGSGTNSTSKMMWARVKGETESELLNMKGNEFKDVYCVRPALMKPIEGQKNISKLQKVYNALSYVTRPFGICNTIEEVGECFISLTINGYEKEIIEVKDITICAKKMEENKQ
ncbi:NAD dependent epimerase/dehydratase family protein [Neocallimastix lanati (nom. inval.)]|jgi:nucleoside-diphosphate-sugar epimerase|uniref:NAD dependent epimerase/dehydratase family protein n=1 Tax=Neocallimastix californiae TaxID=1754190 RepID=A0A1Y2CJA2_9FUNG|nr:NAD dependent epimerase/dehydratase family protein [Neocallimastix sp. JGI-2020a]ORY47131.1 NAD dependent epimerase/dehydratase family protein [Neocallimastix californiae]|eukprot:ORY47131.1 NAD dependent epimerase/dehydratase family protein [Neocallimastix californiae]